MDQLNIKKEEMIEPYQIAIEGFQDLINSFPEIENVSLFCQMMLILCSKTIHGIEGNDFKLNFLFTAAEDKDSLKPIPVSQVSSGSESIN